MLHKCYTVKWQFSGGSATHPHVVSGKVVGLQCALYPPCDVVCGPGVVTVGRVAVVCAQPAGECPGQSYDFDVWIPL